MLPRERVSFAIFRGMQISKLEQVSCLICVENRFASIFLN